MSAAEPYLTPQPDPIALCPGSSQLCCITTCWTDSFLVLSFVMFVSIHVLLYPVILTGQHHVLFISGSQ